MIYADTSAIEHNPIIISFLNPHERPRSRRTLNKRTTSALVQQEAVGEEQKGEQLGRGRVVECERTSGVSSLLSLSNILGALLPISRMQPRSVSPSRWSASAPRASASASPLIIPPSVLVAALSSARASLSTSRVSPTTTYAYTSDTEEPGNSKDKAKVDLTRR